MNRKFSCALLALSLGFAANALAESDRKGCADPALFPVRMPDYYIADCKSADFEAYDFRMLKGQKNRQEGKSPSSPTRSSAESPSRAPWRSCAITRTPSRRLAAPSLRPRPTTG